MSFEEREEISPLVEQALALVRQHVPAEEQLSVEQGLSRLMFEAYRVGLRRARRPKSSSLSMPTVPRGPSTR